MALSLSAASPYLDFITYAERDSAKNLIRDLSSVFSETGEPLMTDLYVIGRTWAEVQYFNLVSFENWTLADRWRVLTMPYNVTGILLSETYIVDSMGYIMADSLGYSVAGDSIRESNIYKAGVQTWVVTSNWFQLDHKLGANRSFSSIYGRSLFLRSYYSRLKKDPVTLTMPRVMKALKPLQFRKENRLQGDYDFVLYEAADTLLPTGETQLLWRIPQVGEDSILMHRGRTYALFFPKDSANGGYGYNWNGKYIFLEGQGSNTIRAKQLYPQTPAPKHSPSQATTLSKSIRSRASLSGSGTMSNSSFCSPHLPPSCLCNLWSIL